MLINMVTTMRFEDGLPNRFSVPCRSTAIKRARASDLNSASLALRLLISLIHLQLA
jgi:hypothetical protein